MIDFFDNLSNRSGATYVSDIMGPEFANWLIQDLSIGRVTAGSFDHSEESPTFSTMEV